MKKSTGKKSKHISLGSIQQKLFRIHLILIVTLALFLGGAGTLINMNFETQKRDQNLQNVAETIAQSPLLRETGDGDVALNSYLDSLRDTLDDIDVISVVDAENVRRYHSTHSLIGTQYDGTMPVFRQDAEGYYAMDDVGPSGTQRRAYAAIYDEDGGYCGFVMAIMLMENIREETLQTFLIFILITIVAILVELMISAELMSSIRESLLGYEPDVFSAMYQVRDNILESLDEGVIAIDRDGTVQFTNGAAVAMINDAASTGGDEIVGKPIDSLRGGELLKSTLQNGEKEFGIRDRIFGNADIIVDRVPIRDGEDVIGAVGILHNRAEYTRLMEDLTGTRYLVDSMRANNHDFTNKLHVILGLIQMEMYDEAISYIENITIVQRETISRIMRAVSEPAIAALLIGKTARAAELNIHFVLREGCRYSGTDMRLPAEVLVTVIGNLIDNAFDAMDAANGDFDAQKELLFGIYSRPGAVLITVDDTGIGIAEKDLPHIFENGYSTKGEGRGTGLHQVKSVVDGLGGKITVESQEGVGASFSVSFAK